MVVIWYDGVDHCDECAFECGSRKEALAWMSENGIVEFPGGINFWVREEDVAAIGTSNIDSWWIEEIWG